jgi:hypothetical protein
MVNLLPILDYVHIVIPNSLYSNAQKIRIKPPPETFNYVIIKQIKITRGGLELKSGRVIGLFNI